MNFIQTALVLNFQ